MNFVYSECETISHLNYRWYITPSGIFPSITTVLGSTLSVEKQQSLDNWKAALGPEADRISKEAAEKGTAVHTMAERLLLKQPLMLEEFDVNAIEAFNSIKLVIKKITPISLEKPIYSPTLRIAGRFDCLGMYENKLCLVDYKTARRIKSEDDIHDYKIQLKFYADAHNELHDTNINDGLIVMASAGFPLTFKINLNDDLLRNELVTREKQFWKIFSAKYSSEVNN